MNKKIVVAGGGTAGWLTALVVQRFMPDTDITLVESDEVGILGAGEGTTPYFVNLTDFLGIPVTDLIKECGASLKLGIDFNNWKGDGTSYTHTFLDHSNPWSFYNSDLKGHQYLQYLDTPDGIYNHLLSTKLMKDKKLPFARLNDFGPGEDMVGNNIQFSTWAVHFNARELAAYLRKIAESRGVKRKEGKIKKIIGDKDSISELLMEDGSLVTGNFFFDCTGFARLIIGRHFNSEWISYKPYLPVDSAVPFFVPHDNDFHPQTDAIAMKYGWMWRIPVKDRYGCGYVFDSRYITPEQALEEAAEYLNLDKVPPVGKVFKFDAGSFKDSIIGNCMAVGLAQSFIEPLEATSIWISTLNLVTFLNSGGVNQTHPLIIKMLNEDFLNRNRMVRDFVFLHYLTPRTDTEFWSNFHKPENQIPDVMEMIEYLKHCPSSWLYETFKDYLFSRPSWLTIANGLDIIGPQHTDHLGYLKDHPNSDVTRLNEDVQQSLELAIDSKEFFKILYNNDLPVLN